MGIGSYSMSEWKPPPMAGAGGGPAFGSGAPLKLETVSTAGESCGRPCRSPGKVSLILRLARCDAGHELLQISTYFCPRRSCSGFSRTVPSGPSEYVPAVPYRITSELFKMDPYCTGQGRQAACELRWSSCSGEG